MFKNTYKRFAPKIYINGPNVYFYGSTNRNNILALTSCVRTLNNDKSIKSINLHMGSNGGDLEYGFLGYDLLKQSNKQINTFCEGSIASSATLIYLAGTNRFIAPHSTMLIHQLSATFNGTYEDIKDMMISYNLSMKAMKNIYKTETVINERTLNYLLKRNVVLSADKCIEYGFAHSKCTA